MLWDFMFTVKVILGALLIAKFGAGGFLAEAAEPGLVQISAGPSGRVVGRVSVVGNLQKPKPLPVFKNRKFCGATVANESLIFSADGRLRNAVVVLRPLDRRVASQPAQLTLDNKHCAFVPHIQVAAVASELLLKNSDPILHTAHARLGMETLFNVGLPKWREVTKRLDRVGVVRINCDVLHVWMSAAIVVTDSPYFVVSDEQGLFRFDGIATGNYEIEIWHERLGFQHHRISVGAAVTTDVDIVYAMGNKQ